MRKTDSAAARRKSHATTAFVANGKAESDSDAALATLKRKRASNGKVKAPPKKKVKKEGSEAMESSASDDEPLTKKRSSGKVKVKPESDVEMKGAEPKRKRTSNKKVKEEEASSETPQAKKGKKKEEEDAEEVYKWWEEQANGDGEEKWQTLEHNGVIFPPPYESLPSHVKMKYKGPNPVVSCVLSNSTNDSTQARRSTSRQSPKRLLAFMLLCWRQIMHRTRHSTRISSRIGLRF